MELRLLELSEDLPVYLDHNATTPVLPEVAEAMLPWLGAQWGNPSSSHAYGRRAAAALASARSSVASLVGAEPDEVIFTSGGTEADNLAILGATLVRERVAMSAVEHPAVAAAVHHRVAAPLVLPVRGDGRVDLDAAASLLREPIGLLTVMLAQNETGVIQPVAELAALARSAARDVVIHCDAAQAVGKIAVDVSALDVDLLTIVGHKFYAPAGIGALVVRRGTKLRAINHGGGQEHGLRSGTEPVAFAVALGAACALARRDLEQEHARQVALRERLWDRLRAGIPEIERSGDGVATLPNTLHVRIPGVVGSEVLAEATHDVAAATGSACHADDDAPSGVLGAMGVSTRAARGALRLSLGRKTTAGDIDRAATALVTAATRARP